MGKSRSGGVQSMCREKDRDGKNCCSLRKESSRQALSLARGEPKRWNLKEIHASPPRSWIKHQLLFSGGSISVMFKTREAFMLRPLGWMGCLVFVLLVMNVLNVLSSSRRRNACNLTPPAPPTLLFSGGGVCSRSCGVPERRLGLEEEEGPESGGKRRRGTGFSTTVTSKRGNSTIKGTNNCPCISWYFLCPFWIDLHS